MTGEWGLEVGYFALNMNETKFIFKKIPDAASQFGDRLDFEVHDSVII
jgi:hypothetical protein